MMKETAARVQFTDYEAAVIFATAPIKYGLRYAPSDQLIKERPDCPWLEPIIARHRSPDSDAKWGDFRSATLPHLRRKRGVSKQVETIVHDLGWLATDQG
jgi:hypothetical protein